MDADGSEPRNLTQNPAKKDVQPAWSPDGRSIAFVSSRDRHQRKQPGLRTPPEQSDIYVMNADGSRKRNLTRDRASDDYPTWSPDGRRIAFLHGRGGGRGQLYVVNADGSGLRNLGRIAGPALFASHPVWSPDGWTIYFGRYLVSTDGSGARKLPYIPLIAVWSPDGRQVAYVANRRTGLPGPGAAGSKDDSEIYVMNADGSGTRRLTHNVGYDGEPAWSPDGREIAFQSKRRFGSNAGKGEIYVMNADGSGKRNLTRNRAQDGSPSWSPDGRRIAFVSNRDGRFEAHVMNADGSGQRSLASQEG
jgi:TolB protein